MFRFTAFAVCARVIAICILGLVLFIPGGAGSNCYAEQHPNGTTTFYFNATVPSQSYSWKINDIVQASEVDFNRTIIESQGPYYINFKSCSENVTYWSEPSLKTIDCPYDCPMVRSTTAPLPERLATGHAVGWSIGIVVVAVFCIVSVYVYWKKKKHKRDQNGGFSCWTFRYKPAVQN